MALSLSDICILFGRKGGRAYSGEPVTQLEHALQTAARAEEAGAPPALITVPFLRPLFADDVLAPIRLHVDAKRYLCATRDGYFDALSADSKRSLALQGGIFTPEEADAFIAQPFAADAVAVRLWDDLAKVANAATKPLAHFVVALEAAQRSPAQSAP